MAEGNGWGLVFANGARAMIARSLIAQNTVAGIEADAPGQA